MIAQAIEKLGILLQGKIPSKIECVESDTPSDRRLAGDINQLIDFMEEIHRFIAPLAQGELNNIDFSRNNFLASPFKELHSRLCHLTWQAKQVAGGDYHQRVDFMGDFSRAFNFMIVALERNDRLLKEKIKELEEALGHIKKLEGFLPICSFCKRIRTEESDPKDQHSWIQLENYLADRTDAYFSHSVCPECYRKYYSDLAEDDDLS
jgi:hypothetical protein